MSTVASMVGLITMTGASQEYPVNNIASGVLSCSDTSSLAAFTDTLPSNVQSNITSLGTIGGLKTAPDSSNTATSGFGASLIAGTAKQNTLGYNILVNVSVSISAAVGGTINVGIGPTSTPTTDAVTSAISIATTSYFSFVVPNNYYLLLTTAGTITLGSITVQVCPL